MTYDRRIAASNLEFVKIEANHDGGEPQKNHERCCCALQRVNSRIPGILLAMDSAANYTLRHSFWSTLLVVSLRNVTVLANVVNFALIIFPRAIWLDAPEAC